MPRFAILKFEKSRHAYRHLKTIMADHAPAAVITAGFAGDATVVARSFGDIGRSAPVLCDSCNGLLRMPRDAEAYVTIGLCADCMQKEGIE